MTPSIERPRFNEVTIVKRPFQFTKSGEVPGLGLYQTVGYKVDSDGKIVFGQVLDLCYIKTPVTGETIAKVYEDQNVYRLLDSEKAAVDLLLKGKPEADDENSPINRFLSLVTSDRLASDRLEKILLRMQQSGTDEYPQTPAQLTFVQLEAIVRVFEATDNPLEILEIKRRDELARLMPFPQAIHSPNPRLLVIGSAGENISWTMKGTKWGDVHLDRFVGIAAEVDFDLSQILGTMAGFALRNNRSWEYFLDSTSSLVKRLAMEIFENRNERSYSEKFLENLRKVIPSEIRPYSQNIIDNISFNFPSYDSDKPYP